MVENGVLDRAAPPFGNCPGCEDQNLNCVLDAGEDTNGDTSCRARTWTATGSWTPPTRTPTATAGETSRTRWSRTAPSTRGSGVRARARSSRGRFPVPIAGQVLVYHPGNPTPEVLADLGSSGGNNFTGLTPYDNRVFGTLAAKDVSLKTCSGGISSGNVCSTDADCSGGTCFALQLHVEEGQRLSAASSRVMHAPQSKSPVHEANPPEDTTLTYNGLCNVGFDFGAPNLGVPLPIVTTAGSGDIISIRLQSARPGTFSMIEEATGYAVGATVVKDGNDSSPQRKQQRRTRSIDHLLRLRALTRNRFMRMRFQRWSRLVSVFVLIAAASLAVRAQEPPAPPLRPPRSRHPSRRRLRRPRRRRHRPRCRLPPRGPRRSRSRSRSQSTGTSTSRSGSPSPAASTTWPWSWPTRTIQGPACSWERSTAPKTGLRIFLGYTMLGDAGRFSLSTGPTRTSPTSASTRPVISPWERSSSPYGSAARSTTARPTPSTPTPRPPSVTSV